MRRLGLALAALLSFAAGTASAASADLTVSINGAAAGLGKITTGSGGTLTTFAVAPSGAVTASGGSATRVHNATAVTTQTLKIVCNGTGSGAASCNKFSKINVTFSGSASSGGRTGTITGLAGSIASGTATIANPTSTSFDIIPSGGTFSNNQQVVVNVGFSIQFANSGGGLGAQTTVTYTVTCLAS